MPENEPQSGADPAGLTQKLTPKGERRWALTGCIGCTGFLVLGILMTILGVRSAQTPAAVWSQLRTYMAFEGAPENFEPLFVVPFFDSRQIVFTRKSDSALVFVQEYSGRERETFEEALDAGFVAELDGFLQVKSDTLSLQGREVDALRYIDQGTFQNASSSADGFRDWLLSAMGMEQNAIADIVDIEQPASVIRIRFSGAADRGGTILMVRSVGTAPMDEAALEDLFAPFDLWAHVGSVPVLFPDAVWAKTRVHLSFKEQPKGFGTLFVLPLEDSELAAIYRESDSAILFAHAFLESSPLQSFLDRNAAAAREDFSDVTSGSMALQGRDVRYLSYVDQGSAKEYSSEEQGLRHMLRVSAITDPEMPIGVTRIQLTGDASSGGTVLVVRSPNATPMDEGALEALLQPFDLWP